MQNLNYILNKYSEITDELNLIHNFPEDVKNALKVIAEKWKKGSKVSRASYIIEIGKKISNNDKKSAIQNIESIEKLLISLDAVINTLDDSVDILFDEKQKEKWEREIVKIINFLNVNSELNKVFPDINYQDLILKNTLKFVVALSQIPGLEKKYSEKILSTKVKDNERNLSVECLLQRARDIDIFSELIILYLKIKEEYALSLIKVIKNYRALELFTKDYCDIEIDIKNKCNTPTVTLFKKYVNNKKYFKKIIKLILDSLFSEFKKIDKAIETKEEIIFIKEIAQEKYKQLIKNLNDFD